MKFKFLSVIMAFAVALAFSACDEKKASASNASETSESKEQVEEEIKAPTGDAAADAKQAVEEAIVLMNNVDFSNVKTAEDAEKFEAEFSKQIEELQKKYEDFYKEKGEDALKKFNEECDKLEKDPEISKKMEEAQKAMMEKAQKALEGLMKSAA
ncbi:MAG: hypothetical protein J5629_03170 [Muribaculaceae bacterium]|nr:hypothetical protein [Muribaculaceae bacterium]